MIGVSALKRLADDSRMPEDIARELRFQVNSLDMTRSMSKHSEKHSSPLIRNANKGAFVMASQGLLKSLENIFPEEVIEYFRNLG